MYVPVDVQRLAACDDCTKSRPIGRWETVRHSSYWHSIKPPSSATDNTSQRRCYTPVDVNNHVSECVSVDHPGATRIIAVPRDETATSHGASYKNFHTTVDSVLQTNHSTHPGTSIPTSCPHPNSHSRTFRCKCDFWAVMVSLYVLIMGLPYLYRSPRPDDILFRYCIMARGLSRDRHNQLVQEIANEVDSKEDAHMLTTVSQQITNMEVDLLEFFENSFSLNPKQRGGSEQAGI